MAEITGKPCGSIRTQSGRRKITILLPDDVDLTALNAIDTAEEVVISTGIMSVAISPDMETLKTHTLGLMRALGMEGKADAPSLLTAMEDCQ